MCLQAHAHYRKTRSQENEIRETQSSKVTFWSGSLSSTQSVLHSHWYWWSSFVPGSLLLLLLSHVPLYVTPRTAAHQAPLSLGFSRQEHWSGLPFPFPMHACRVASVVSDSVRPHGQQSTRLLCPQDSPDKSSGVGCHFLLQGVF